MMFEHRYLIPPLMLIVAVVQSSIERFNPGATSLNPPTSINETNTTQTESFTTSVPAPEVSQNDTNPATNADPSAPSSVSDAGDMDLITRYYTFLESKNYFEAGKVSKELTKRARQSGDQKKIKAARALQENLDILSD